MKSLVQLPLELLDIILSDIEAPPDLLALALSCRLLHETIVPAHLPWRRITACEHDASLFSLLASNKRVARGVTSMVVSEQCESHRRVSTAHSLCSPLHMKGYRPVIPNISDSPAHMCNLAPSLHQAAQNCSQLEELRLDVEDLEPWTEFLAAMRERGDGKLQERLKVVEQPGRCSGRWLSLRIYSTGRRLQE
ncbi:hypothetical protein CALCODRAFT_500201 [Calocera cornea HHB12733]|uniref:F-box domain-containing protein n=1 Tax=Calocera cornea HHB12733 TaxID=1353952 RepID=A0A165E625_9BASI|nr:hypothetical protein CALCODRAFT_500201 [Calocera cornea HHB12733]